MKTNKSYTKRFKVTKTGKVLARKPGQNHFNAKASSQERLEKKNLNEVKLTPKAKNRFLPHN